MRITRPAPEVGAAALVSALFAFWSRTYIYLSSFRSIGHSRVYCLFDDAMISMRYAWNLSHGRGLVWNVGEHVQGYSNLLMTLVMSMATLVLSKSMAVLSIQVLGAILMVVIAFLCMRISDYVFPKMDKRWRSLVRILGFISGLAYYPLVYWSLMGMETGLLTVLMLSGVMLSFEYACSGDRRILFAAALLFGLAFLTRNDALVFVIIVGIYLAWERRYRTNNIRLESLLLAASLVVLIALAEGVFQYYYYGAWLPNTYVLKLTGMTLLPRLENGIGFVLPFGKEMALTLILAIVGVFLEYRPEKLVLLLLMVGAIFYQVYIGGDAWNTWRIMAPAVPGVLLLNIVAFVIAWSRIVRWLSTAQSMFALPRAIAGLSAAVLTLLCFAVVIVSINFRFRYETSYFTRPYRAPADKENIDAAIALNDLLDKDATIGVFRAGTIPYYTDYKAIDFLGKSDTYIANLPPDMSGAVSWSGMSSVPGHNKYDLIYSIVEATPTYVQGLVWGNQNLTEWAKKKYVKVEYKGVTLYLLKDSPDVFWNKLILP